MRDTTDITILLDRSGSMQRIASDTVGGINTFIKEQQALPGDALLSLVMFDSQGYDRVIDRVPIRAVPPLLSMAPRGDTPLLDAMARTIDETGARLAAVPPSERPAHVVVVVVTDGEENASKAYGRAQVFAKVSHQREHYQWLFLYLGANQDAIAVGHEIGIAQMHAGAYGVTPQSVHAMYRNASAKVADNRAGLAPDVIAFSDSERASMWDAATAGTPPATTAATE